MVPLTLVRHYVRQPGVAYAFPLGLVVYSALAVASVQISRGFLVNYHVQLALPGVAGVYAMCRALATNATLPRYLNRALGLMLMCSVYGYIPAFRVHGPTWKAEGRATEHYMATYEANPLQRKPFPENFLVTPDLVQFLRRYGLPPP